MTSNATLPWEAKRTEETRNIETLLGEQFERVDSYRYNSASIRIRVIDSKFEQLSREERDALVEPLLEKLPPETQRDIVTLFTFAPSELKRATVGFKEYLLNNEFDDPTPSLL